MLRKAVLCLFIMMAASANAQETETGTWRVRLGDWNLFSNWSGLTTMSYPDNGANVVITAGNARIPGGQSYTVGNVTITDEANAGRPLDISNNASLYVLGNMDIDFTGPVSLYPTVRNMGTLDVAGNVTMEGPDNGRFNVNGETRVGGNFISSGDILMQLDTGSVAVGGEFGVLNVGIRGGDGITANRLSTGMGMNLTYDAYSLTKGTEFVVENASSINSLTLTVQKGQSGLYTDPVIGGLLGDVTIGTPTLVNNSNAFLKLTDSGTLMIDESRYTDYYTWNYDEEATFNSSYDASNNRMNIKLAGSENPEIIVNIRSNSANTPIETLATRLASVLNNSAAIVSVYSNNQLLLSGDFMDNGFAYLFFQWDDAWDGPEFGITSLELRQIPTPEPATWAMMLLGSIGIFVACKRRRNKNG